MFQWMVSLQTNLFTCHLIRPDIPGMRPRDPAKLQAEPTSWENEQKQIKQIKKLNHNRYNSI